MNRHHSYILLISCVVIIFMGLLFPGFGITKEDTAHLIFKKNPSLSRKTFTYTVKKGDHLLDIIKNETGITKNRYTLVRRFNPHIKNLNVIHPGQKLVLPMKINRLASKRTGSVLVAAAETDRGTGVLQTAKGIPSMSRLSVMQTVLRRMNSSLMTSGRYIIPLPEIGQITIDCTMIPVIEFDDGSVVFLDFKWQMPENIKRLIRRQWTTYTVVPADSKEDILKVLSDAINASRAYSMKRRTDPLAFGQKPSLQVPVDWQISGKKTSSRGDYTQTLVTLKAEEQRLPRGVLAYMGKNGLVFTEILNDSVLPPWADLPADKTFTVLSRLNPSSVKDLIFDLLLRIGYKPASDKDVQIFDSRTDGFNLAIKADIEVSSGSQRVIFTVKPLPKQFIEILEGKATAVVHLSEGDQPKTAIEKTLTALKLPYSTIPYMFPISTNAALEKVKIFFPTIRIAMDKETPLYLIDFNMDGDIFSLLHDKMGFNILRY